MKILHFLQKQASPLGNAPYDNPLLGSLSGTAPGSNMLPAGNSVEAFQNAAAPVSDFAPGFNAGIAPEYPVAGTEFNPGDWQDTPEFLGGDWNAPEPTETEQLDALQAAGEGKDLQTWQLDRAQGLPLPTPAVQPPQVAENTAEDYGGNWENEPSFLAGDGWGGVTGPGSEPPATAGYEGFQAAAAPVEFTPGFNPGEAPAAPEAPTPEALFAKAHGSAYDPNSSMDRQKMEAIKQQMGGTPAPAAPSAQSPEARFAAAHGSPYDPNSSMDRQKMQQLMNPAPTQVMAQQPPSAPVPQAPAAPQPPAPQAPTAPPVAQPPVVQQPPTPAPQAPAAPPVVQQPPTTPDYSKATAPARYGAAREQYAGWLNGNGSSADGQRLQQQLDFARGQDLEAAAGYELNRAGNLNRAQALQAAQAQMRNRQPVSVRTTTRPLSGGPATSTGWQRPGAVRQPVSTGGFMNTAPSMGSRPRFARGGRR